MKNYKYRTHFIVANRQIIVDDTYVGYQVLNSYFERHKIKHHYSIAEFEALIQAVAYSLDEDAIKEGYFTAEDRQMIEEMLEA